MENPASHGVTERIIDRVILEHSEMMRAREPVIGLSLTRKIADALRAEDLINPEKERVALERDGVIQHCEGCQGHGDVENGEIGWCNGLQAKDFD